MADPRNLITLQSVGKDHASRTILSDVSLGISAGEHGVVGRNGDGKRTPPGSALRPAREGVRRLERDRLELAWLGASELVGACVAGGRAARPDPGASA